MTPAQPQREDQGPALPSDREPISAGRGPSGLVSIWGSAGSEGACLKAGLIRSQDSLPPSSLLPACSSLLLLSSHLQLCSSAPYPTSQVSHCQSHWVISSISLSRTSFSPSVKWGQLQLPCLPQWADHRRKSNMMKRGGFGGRSAGPGAIGRHLTG